MIAYAGLNESVPGTWYSQRRTLALMLDPSVDADEELARGFAAHEPWAFEDAYRRYGSLLYSTAFNVLGNSDDAADTVHDALARVWRSPRAYSRARGAVRSFLLVCVRNEAISRRRSQARRLRLTERMAAEPQRVEEIDIGDPIERDRLRAAMAQLPAEQRTPLEMAYYQGKTHTEIASELQTPLGTIKSRIAMGLRKLASALK